MSKKPFLATYRLQLNQDFTFQDAADIVPYISLLNVSHLYLSPVFESSPGSTHGYDIIDFSKISKERGGENGLRILAATIQNTTSPMNLLLDIVPNHMGIAEKNP